MQLKTYKTILEKNSWNKVRYQIRRDDHCNMLWSYQVQIIGPVFRTDISQVTDQW